MKQTNKIIRREEYEARIRASLPEKVTEVVVPVAPVLSARTLMEIEIGRAKLVKLRNAGTQPVVDAGG